MSLLSIAALVVLWCVSALLTIDYIADVVRRKARHARKNSEARLRPYAPVSQAAIAQELSDLTGLADRGAQFGEAESGYLTTSLRRVK